MPRPLHRDGSLLFLMTSSGDETSGRSRRDCRSGDPSSPARPGPIRDRRRDPVSPNTTSSVLSNFPFWPFTRNWHQLVWPSLVLRSQTTRDSLLVNSRVSMSIATDSDVRYLKTAC